jgi:hypothetical protein
LNVPYGYLVLLLVNLCQNENVRRKILSLSPDGRLTELILVAEEFIRIHQKTDREMYAGAEGVEVYQSYTKRLMAMVDRLKETSA